MNASISMFQFISAEYQTEVAEKDIGDIMVDVPHQKLIPALFHLIWTKIRNEASGDSVDMLNWPLKVWMAILQVVLVLMKFLLRTHWRPPNRSNVQRAKTIFTRRYQPSSR